MNKSKTEKLLSPSSSWRENHHLPHRKNPKSPTTVSSSGCLPGFFNLLLSTFHFSSNRRKSITLGSKKRDLKTLISVSPENGVVAPPIPTEDAARVSLVGALEKCDRDLEELRRTIDVIKTTFILHKKLEVSPPSPLPSPSPPPQLFTVDRFLSDKTVAKDAQTQIKKIREEESDHEYNNRIYRINNNKNANLMNRFDYNVHDVVLAKRVTGRRVRGSLRESVNEVCDEVDFGQRREVCRIVLSLHDEICRDLVSETVREFFHCHVEEEEEKEYSKVRRGDVGSLPLDACRRRLVF